MNKVSELRFLPFMRTSLKNFTENAIVLVVCGSILYKSSSEHFWWDMYPNNVQLRWNGIQVHIIISLFLNFANMINHSWIPQIWFLEAATWFAHEPHMNHIRLQKVCPNFGFLRTRQYITWVGTPGPQQYVITYSPPNTTMQKVSS